MADVVVKKDVEPIYLKSLKEDNRMTGYLKSLEVCEYCPLGAKKQTKVIDGQKIEMMLPAQCKFYQPFRKKCIFPPQEQVMRIKTFAEIDAKEGTMNLQKALIMHAVMDAEISRKAEVAIHGQPKFYTKEFSEQALKYTNELNKIQFGEQQQHQHIHFGESLAEKMVANIFKEEEKKEKEINFHGEIVVKDEKEKNVEE